jgi:membrane protein DedA with SNARE-associated domain
MPDLPHALADLAPYLEHYGYFAVFGGLLLESFGLPLPGESLLIAGAALASQGALHLIPLLVTAWGAAVLGDNIGYAIGRFGGRRLILRHGRHIGITERRLVRVEKFFGRYGAGVVLAARFFAVLRQLNGLVAGAAGMGWWRFLAYNALGAAVWVGVWGIGVYVLGHDLRGLVPWVHGFGYALLAAGAIAIGLLLAGWLSLSTKVRKRSVRSD